MRAVGGISGNVAGLQMVGGIAGGDGDAAFEDREVLTAAGGMGVGGEFGVGGEGEFVDPPGWATNSPSSLLRWSFPAEEATE